MLLPRLTSLRWASRPRLHPGGKIGTHIRSSSSSSSIGGGGSGSGGGGVNGAEAVVVNIGGVRAAIPAGAPANPELVPCGFLPWDTEQLPRSTARLLRWLTQKRGLGEDVFLLGPPGPSRRQAAMAWAELFKLEVEVVSLSADTTESDLKQRREIVGGDVVFIDSAPVRAALHGRLLLLEGIERAERNVLPTLNNLLEAREMSLEDGRTIISARAWDEMLANEPGLTATALHQRGLCRAHPQFLVVGVGLPVPPFVGKPLDPPLRSRFQGLSAVPALSGGAVLEAIQAALSQTPGQLDNDLATTGDTSDGVVHALVNFAELTVALTRAEAKSGGGTAGNSSGSESAVARLDLAPFVHAARTLLADTRTSPQEALGRVFPALLLDRQSAGISSGGRGTALSRAMQAAAEKAFEQQTSTERWIQDMAPADPSVTVRDFNRCIRASGLPTGPHFDDGNAVDSGNGSGFVELVEPHSRIITDMLIDSRSPSDHNYGEHFSARDLLLLAPKGTGKSALAFEFLR